MWYLWNWWSSLNPWDWLGSLDFCFLLFSLSLNGSITILLKLIWILLSTAVSGSIYHFRKKCQLANWMSKKCYQAHLFSGKPGKSMWKQQLAGAGLFSYLAFWLCGWHCLLVRRFFWQLGSDQPWPKPTWNWRQFAYARRPSQKETSFRTIHLQVPC